MGGYFQGICSNYMTKRRRVSAGAERRLTGQGTELSGPLICKCHSDGGGGGGRQGGFLSTPVLGGLVRPDLPSCIFRIFLESPEQTATLAVSTELTTTPKLLPKLVRGLTFGLHISVRADLDVS